MWSSIQEEAVAYSGELPPPRSSGKPHGGHVGRGERARCSRRAGRSRTRGYAFAAAWSAESRCYLSIDELPYVRQQPRDPVHARALKTTKPRSHLPIPCACPYALPTQSSPDVLHPSKQSLTRPETRSERKLPPSGTHVTESRTARWRSRTNGNREKESARGACQNLGGGGRVVACGA